MKKIFIVLFLLCTSTSLAQKYEGFLALEIFRRSDGKSKEEVGMPESLFFSFLFSTKNNKTYVTNLETGGQSKLKKRGLNQLFQTIVYPAPFNVRPGAACEVTESVFFTPITRRTIKTQNSIEVICSDGYSSFVIYRGSIRKTR